MPWNFRLFKRYAALMTLKENIQTEVLLCPDLFFSFSPTCFILVCSSWPYKSKLKQWDEIKMVQLSKFYRMNFQNSTGWRICIYIESIKFYACKNKVSKVNIASYIIFYVSLQILFFQACSQKPTKE